MSIKSRAINGVKWTSASSIITLIFQFLQMSILAKLLGPSAFGLVGMIMIVIGFTKLFADMGISNAIIFRQDTTGKQLSSLYWLNIMAGFIVFIILIIITPLVIYFYQEPKLQELMYWASLSFLITPFGQQFQILLQKELRFNSLAKIEITSTICGTLSTIIFTLLGFGVLSLVWGQLIGTTTKMLYLVFIGCHFWKPEMHFRKTDLDGFLSFGLFQLGERTANYLNSNIDYLIIGKFLGADALGLYSLAYNMIILPVSRINPIITKVAFPVFSKMQNQNEKLKTGYLKVLKLLSFSNFPILFGLSATSITFIPYIFGEEWDLSIILIQILAGVGLFRSIGNPLGSLLLSKGRADIGFKWNILLMLTQIPGILLGLYFGGVIGVAFAFLLLEVIYSILSYFIIIRSILGSCLKEYILSMLPSMWISIVMYTIVIITEKILNNYSDLNILVVQIVVGVLIYFLFSILFNKKLIKEFKRILH